MRDVDGLAFDEVVVLLVVELAIVLVVVDVVCADVCGGGVGILLLLPFLRDSSAVLMILLNDETLSFC